MGDSKMVGLRILTLSLVLVLLPETAVSRRHLVQDVAKFLDQKIDFIGHDEGFRKHIRALEKDLKMLEKSKVSNSRVVTSLNTVHTIMMTVEDHVVNLARMSKTDVSGLQISLYRYKRQVDRGLSTEDTYRSIMDHTGMLINHSNEILSKEIKEISKAEIKLNEALSELRLLKEQEQRELEQEQEFERENQATGALGSLFGAIASITAAAIADDYGDYDLADEKIEESFYELERGINHSVDLIFGLLDETEGNLKKSLDYFEKQSVLIKKEDVEIQKLSDAYNDVTDNWYPEELEEIALEDDDWENDLMVYIRSLKRSVTRFVSRADSVSY